MDFSNFTPYEQRRLAKIAALPPEAQAVARTAMAQAEAQNAENQMKRAMWGQEFAAREKNRERSLDLGNRRLNAASASQSRRFDLADQSLADQEAQDKEGAILGLLGLGVTGATGYLGRQRDRDMAEALRKLAARY